MRVRGAVITTIILAAAAVAQDQSLGDLARQTRAHNAGVPKPAKTLSDEELDAGPVTVNDDPLTVVTKAAKALLRDTSHRCRTDYTDNSGSTWLNNTTIEVAGADRFRILALDHGQQVYTIFVSDDVYQRVGPAPWEKVDGAELASHLDALKLPEALKLDYKSGDFKLVGPESRSGSPTFHYRYRAQDSTIERTVDIWVGSADNLPLRTEMTTRNLETGASSHQTFECGYGTQIGIYPPI